MLLLEKALSLVAPHECLLCGREGAVFCQWCFDLVCSPVPARCFLCQKATDNSAVCLSCRRKTKLKHVWVCSEYKEGAKALVHKLKFERAGQAAATTIATYLDAELPYFEPEIIITHVPTATSRKRQRGYDQSSLIAKALAKKRDLIYAPLLLRLGQSRQVGAKRWKRQQQLKGAFRPVNNSLIKNARIVVIDDVLTTGTTISSAAQALKIAGAKEVNGAVFARIS